jgi:iron complex outermembrane receptor protein
LSIAALIATQWGSPAHAQSTGSAAVEEQLTEVVVSARRINTLGSVTEQSATKTRVAITQEYLATQVAGQSIMQSLNQVPGVNFTNNDAYGSSGGNLRIRGFEGSRIAATFDGMPLNDSGNYALFTNQLLDPELVERIDVNLGTTDVDSPTASATGGTVNFRSITPSNVMGGQAVASVGEDAYRRLFTRFDTGEIGPWNTKAWIAASTTAYDKFKGPGDMEKQQYNAKVLQEFGDNGDFASLAFHWNRNRVAFLRTASAASYRQFGFDYDNLASCTRDAPTAGVRDNDNATNVAGTAALPATDNLENPASCTNYWGVRVNPTDTGNIRGQSLFHLGESLRLTIDPSFQYVLANGGGSTVMDETPAANNADRRIVGSSGQAGFDLNGDGDILDSVRLYTPSNTNTKRYGLTSSLIWDINDDNRVRVAYSLDYAEHKQTAAWGGLDANGNPVNVFAGRQGPKVPTADGSYLRGRDRYSIAQLNQVSGEYRGEFLDDQLVLQIGVRAPFFKRELNQYCYTPDGGSGGTAGGSLCTTQVPVATRANGNVVFINAANAVQFIAPYSDTIKFDEILPNVGTTYKLTNTQSVYASYAENLSAPRTDNLYPVRRQADGTIGRGIPDSETTKAYDIGWRFNSADFLASAAVYYIDYNNRIVSSFDPDLGFSVDRNVGKVEIQGVDLQAGWRALEMLTLSGSASYNDSELQENVPISATQFSPTKGKKLVETPEWTYALRADLSFGEHVHAGIQGKYVGERPATDTNDEFAPAYTVVDLDASYQFEMGRFKSLEAQINVINLLDKDYFGSISSGTGGTSVGFYSIGAPRTVSLAITASF